MKWRKLSQIEGIQDAERHNMQQQSVSLLKYLHVVLWSRLESAFCLGLDHKHIDWQGTNFCRMARKKEKRGADLRSVTLRAPARTQTAPSSRLSVTSRVSAHLRLHTSQSASITHFLVWERSPVCPTDSSIFTLLDDGRRRGT